MTGHDDKPIDITTSTATQRHRSPRAGAPSERWVCPCQQPPVLLATWDSSGRVNVKVRDRYWHFTGFGQVKAICPRCATEHVLDLGAIQHCPS